jgi:dTDP-4-dehydrorhamnose 3,5-epimerase
MTFEETGLAGAFLITPDRLVDERGFFARSYCAKEFGERGLNPAVVQCNISFNAAKGTLRGMHYQELPCQEARLVRCTAGAVHDVIIDLRRGSRTCMQHVGVRLDAESRRMLYVPEGFAHGFITLEDRTEVFYQMSQYYSPARSRGVRWDDPAFAIHWPMQPVVMSERDRGYPDFGPEVLCGAGDT